MKLGLESVFGVALLLAACESGGDTTDQAPVAAQVAEEEVLVPKVAAAEPGPPPVEGRRGVEVESVSVPPVPDATAVQSVQPPPVAVLPPAEPVKSEKPSTTESKPATPAVSPPADTTPPDTALSAASGQSSVVSGQSVNKTEITFTLSASDDGRPAAVDLTFMCQLDVGTPSPCTSPFTPSPFADGQHVLAVYAVDAAGNKDPTPASFTWTVDLTPPAFAGIVSAKIVSTTQVDLAWTASAESTAVYHICQSAVAGSCASSFTSSHTTQPGAVGLAISGLTPSATYFFVVRAQDEAGNTESNTVEKAVKMSLGPTLAFQVDGSQAFEMFGLSVANLGDVDADGVPDIGVGASGTTANGIELAGSVSVYSGADGSQIVQATGSNVGDQLGFGVFAAGDVNADGTPDFGAGAPTFGTDVDPFTGAIRIFSGLDGSLLAERIGEAMNMLGVTSAEIGDVNSDGMNDCAWGHVQLNEADWSTRGVVDVGPCGGGQGSVLYTLMSELMEDEFGAAVSPAGDLDGDGRPDLLVGSPMIDLEGQDDVGRVYLYSGATGEPIRSVDGTELAGEFGRSVAALDDVDDDGIPDFAVGEPGAAIEGTDIAGRACVHSGATGQMIVCMNGGEGVSGYGMSVYTVGDFDADGKSDLAVWEPDPARTFVDILSSADGLRLYRIEAPDIATYFGQSIASADLNDDGKPDLIIGAPQASPNGLQFAGSVFVYAMQ